MSKSIIFVLYIFAKFSLVYSFLLVYGHWVDFLQLCDNVLAAVETLIGRLHYFQKVVVYLSMWIGCSFNV